MKKEPRIGVVIITYNHVDYIGECIQSILAQTLSPYEIFIVDDDSTDGTWEVINDFALRYPDKIRTHRHEKNVGIVHNANFAKKNVKGDLFAWIEGDDRWLPRKLELEWKALQREPEAKIAYSSVYTIDAEGDRLGKWHISKDPEPPSGDIFIETFAKLIFHNSPSIFRNQLMYSYAIDEIGYNDLNLESYWDWDEKIRLTSRFSAAYSGEALVEYRQHDRGFSKKDPEKHLRAFIQVYEKNLPLLDGRSKAEIALVKTSCESLIALRQEKLPDFPYNEYYALKNVYERNRTMLSALSGEETENVKQDLAKLLKTIARQESQEGNKKFRALGYFLKSWQYDPQTFDPRWIAWSLFPDNPVYKALGKAYRGIFKG